MSKIASVLHNFLKTPKDNGLFVFESFTGSGKSYIALIIAGVLSKYFGKQGYVLISDLSLLQQYYDLVLCGWMI